MTNFTFLSSFKVSLIDRLDMPQIRNRVPSLFPFHFSFPPLFFFFLILGHPGDRYRLDIDIDIDSIRYGGDLDFWSKELGLHEDLSNIYGHKYPT